MEVLSFSMGNCRTIFFLPASSDEMLYKLSWPSTELKFNLFLLSWTFHNRIEAIIFWSSHGPNILLIRFVSMRYWLRLVNCESICGGWKTCGIFRILIDNILDWLLSYVGTFDKQIFNQTSIVASRSFEEFLRKTFLLETRSKNAISIYFTSHFNLTVNHH